MKDCFEILNIDENADESVIKAAIQKMLQKYPQDKYPEKYSDVVAAGKMLLNPLTRDACLKFHRMNDGSKRAYKMAEHELDSEKPANAIKILEKAIKTEEYTDHLYLLLAEACAKEGRYLKAINAYEKLIPRYPYDMRILLNYTEVCIIGNRFRKAFVSGRKGYMNDRNNIMFMFYYVKTLMHFREYKTAEQVLNDAIKNSSFSQHRHGLYAKLAFVLFVEKKIDKALHYMEMLPDLEAGEDERIESGDIILNMLDYFLDSQMYEEANRCMCVILKLLPERDDIAEAKKSLEKMLKLEPEFSALEEDGSIPESLIALIANELFPAFTSDMTEYQRKAYSVMNEYQIINDYPSFILPIRYIKTKYPEIYALKGDFFDQLQNPKKRRILSAKYKTLIYQYQDAFDGMLDEWLDEDEDGDEDDYEYEDYLQDDEKHDIHENEPESKIKYEDNVRPFVKREDMKGKKQK